MGFLKKNENNETSLVERQNKDLVTSKKKKKLKDQYIMIDSREPVKPEKYYEDRSNWFRYARFVSTAALVIFILFMFVFYRDQFTGENFRYLIKHIDMNSSGTIDEFKTVVYDSAEGTVFCEYQNDFVIASPGFLKIYDYKGVMTLSSLPKTETPKVSVSQRYILLYDRGDKDYYVYNSFSMLRQRDCTGNIIMADMSDSGVFVIVTESIEYAAHIYVYNENFEQINEIKKNSTVSGVCLSEDGKKLAVTTIDVNSSAKLVSDFTVYDLEKSSIIMERRIEEEIPVSLCFNQDGCFNILTNQKLRSYDMNGDERTCNISASQVSLFAMSNNLLCYSEIIDMSTYTNRIHFIDGGKIEKLCSAEFDGKLLKIGVGGGYAYVLTEEALCRVDVDGNIKVKRLTSPVSMVITADGSVFVCYESRAELIKFND